MIPLVLVIPLTKLLFMVQLHLSFIVAVPNLSNPNYPEDDISLPHSYIELRA